MSLKYKDFFKTTVKEEKQSLNEGFFSDLISNIIMLLVRDETEKAYHAMMDDPRLIRAAKKFENAKLELEKEMESDQSWKLKVIKKNK